MSSFLSKMPEETPPQTGSTKRIDVAALAARAQEISQSRKPDDALKIKGEAYNPENSGAFLVANAESNQNNDAAEELAGIKRRIENVLKRVPEDDFIGREEILITISRTTDLIKQAIGNTAFITYEPHQVSTINANVISICGEVGKAVSVALKKGAVALTGVSFRNLGIIAAQIYQKDIKNAMDFQLFLQSIEREEKTEEEEAVLKLAHTILQQGEALTGTKRSRKLPSMVAIVGSYTEYIERQHDHREDIPPFDTQWAEFMIIKTARNLLEGGKMLDVSEKALSVYADQAEYADQTEAEMQNLITTDKIKIEDLSTRIRKYEQEYQKLSEPEKEERDDHNLDNLYKKAKELLAMLLLTPQEIKKDPTFKFDEKWERWFSLLETSFRNQPTPTDDETRRQTRTMLRVTGESAQTGGGKAHPSASKYEKVKEIDEDKWGLED